MLKRIDIYFTPDCESAASLREVADYVGVSVETFKIRLACLGEDHYLTYYPGNIPQKLRRAKKKGSKHSKLKSICSEIREPLEPYYARLLVVKLIKASQRDYRLHRCEKSRKFLLNENGMLQWYIEAYPRVDAKAFIERMKKWVETALPA